MTVQLRRHKFTVSDYMRMGECGILGPDERTELIEGEIVQMAPIGSRHAGCVNRLIRLFGSRLREGAQIAAQNPLDLDQYSAPQPDFMLLRRRADDYANSHPKPPDVLLLVEVADTTLNYDWKTKEPLYRGRGVREVWIVDLDHAHLLVSRGNSQEVLSGGDTVAPLAFPDERFAVSEILGLHLGE